MKVIISISSWGETMSVKNSGRQSNQKLKPYLVLQYLLRQSDENHVVHAHEIVSYLEEDCGIAAERRSIYRDIEEINKALLMLEECCTIQEAEEMLANDKYGSYKTIVYDKSRNGFYVRQRQYDLDDLRLMAECVYTSKFIPKKEADRLVEVICGFASDHQHKQIQHSADVVGRVRISNDAVLRNIPFISDAMSKQLDGQKHIPEQISFKYVSFSVSNVRDHVERRQGERITVSPYYLLISDGFYYMLAYNSSRGRIQTYRVDRMRDVQLVGVPREGAEAFSEINLATLTKQRFSMMKGRERLVTIRFVNHLIDTVVDRLGVDGVQYSKVDDNHFSVTAKLEVGSMFYGWLLGFGKGAKLISPDAEVEKFAAYIQDVQKMY